MFDKYYLFCRVRQTLLSVRILFYLILGIGVMPRTLQDDVYVLVRFFWYKGILGK